MTYQKKRSDVQLNKSKPAMGESDEYEVKLKRNFDELLKKEHTVSCKNSTHQKSGKKAPCFKNNFERNNFFWVSGVKEYDFEVVDPGPQEPTIRLLNFDLETLMLILGGGGGSKRKF
ncbi:hypothetical protein BpHYR1_045805 [Brachionus plicatilis]|uniref:Uncharacterized protein n=1 Tax=Brachionus plicatilis TaxID=10195 RepID=A0A3M7SZA1_BRAPC|nr:hypothetical protein BpHYR1_045805 [Brachionus plicatilis]